jgi:N-acetylglucosaminyldiphosphoundecaprenol N-acetyl-beta-D-mannosaminyltransferase
MFSTKDCPILFGENLPRIDIRLLGRKINCMDIASAVNLVRQACNEDRRLLLSYYNIHTFNLSIQLPWFFELLESSDVTLCDSVGILGAIRYMGLNLPLAYRVSYSLLMPELLKVFNWDSVSLFMLGSRPEFLEAAVENVRQKYPAISVDGHHGYFQMKNPEQNEAVIERINKARPQVLLIGMGSPIQEEWLALNRHQLQSRVVLLGGAAIDRLAGVVPDCPTFISNVGMEWLYRLCREPKRLSLRYLLGNPAFVLQILLAHSSSYTTAELIKVSPNGLLIQP